MTLPNDTLVCDTARLAYWKNNPAFDYERELVAPDHNLMDWFFYMLRRFLGSIFGSEFADKYSEIFFFIVFIIVIGLIIWYMYHKRPELFMRNKKIKTPYIVHEDNIYGIDFEKEINTAIACKDYKKAVRFLYLQTLKYLSDNELIAWQLYKTPTEYIYEIRQERIRPAFRDLTNRFLRVRYGNYEADKDLFDGMLSLSNIIREGGES